jgi:hypothetical protein
MNEYTETFATVINSDGDRIVVQGPTVVEWAELSRDWQKTYRPIALENAAEAGLIVYPQGMRVIWKRGEPFA